MQTKNLHFFLCETLREIDNQIFHAESRKEV